MKTVSFTKSYGGQTVLTMPELELCPGEICAVIGANGSGKSTLAGVLSRTVEADDKGKTLPDEIAVGYMPQRSFAFRMSVIANVKLGGRDEDRAVQMMEELGIAHLARRSAKGLSGGETARMALARVLMKKWDLLVLDEPTASMDIRSSLRAEELILRECRETGCAVILITHSLSQARRLADRVIFLDGGELVEQGRAAEVLRTPKDPRTVEFLRFFGGEEN